MSDLDRFAALDLDDPDGGCFVDESDGLGVGRPIQTVAVTLGPLGQGSFPALSVQAPQIDLVFAAPVAPVGQVPAVGRPGGIPVEAAAGIRQVEAGAFLDGKVEDLAPGFHGHPLGLDGKGHVADGAGDVDPAGDLDRQVRDHPDVDGLVLTGLQVHQVKPAAAFKDDVVRSGRHVDDVEVGHLGDLFDFAGAGVMAPDVQAHVLVAVGQEIDGRADPGRLAVDGLVPGDVHGLVGPPRS